MSIINLELNATVPESRIHYYSQKPGGYLTTPKSYYRSLKFAIDYFYDNIPKLKKMRIPENTPLSDIDIRQIDEIITNHIKKKYDKSCTVYFPTDEDNGKLVISSSEQEYKVYVVGMSFLPYLKKSCKEAEQVIVDCIKILHRKNVSVWENYFMDQDMEYLHSRIEESKEDGSLMDDFSEDFIEIYESEVESIKYMSRYGKLFDKWTYPQYLYNNLKRSKHRLDKLVVQPPFMHDIDKLVGLIWKIKDSISMETLIDISKDAFMKRNDLTEEDMQDEHVPSFDDLFLIHWYSNELTADDMATYISEHTGNFGYIEGIVEYQLKEGEDVDTSFRNLMNQSSIAYTLPEIFETYCKLEDKIREYLKNTHNGRQIKMQFCNQDL